MDRFPGRQINVLVATDMRPGLDIASISHVINFDIPGTATDYIHRIGRTGSSRTYGRRPYAGDSDDKATILDIEKILGTSIENGCCRIQL